MMPFNFNNIEVSADKFYGVYLLGNGVPGTPPPGAAAAMAAARAATVTTTTSTTTTTTTTTPWSSFKNQKSGNTKPTTTANTLATTTGTAVTTTPSATLAIADVGPTQIVKSAIRLLTEAQAKTYLINPLTPTACLGAGHNLLFIKTGRCTVQVVLRTNGKVLSTVTTKVTDGTVVPSDLVVAVSEPTVAYFIDGTALVKPASKKAIGRLTSSAKTASSIVVTGHSGNIGGEQANMVQLSQKRASAVRSLLRARGTTRTIAIWSFGAKVPLTSSKSNKQQDLNRRSEIYIIP
jgi:outer membrane protein OmpA-like peptidoglycan-associated protein